MKKPIMLSILFAMISLMPSAQDGTYEGRPVYDATAYVPAASVAQNATATFTFTRRVTARTQQEADRKLAAYLAPWAEFKNKSGLCVVVNDACLEQGGQVVYDLQKVAAAIEAILEDEISAAVKARFLEPKLRDARVKAEQDFDKEEKPEKAAAPRSTPRRPR